MFTIVFNYVTNLALISALNQLWAMINGLQLTTHLQLLNLKFPANSAFMLNFLVNIANFDVLPVEAIWFFFDLPEQGAHSLNFQNSGYEYKFLIENMGTQFFFVQGYLFIVLLTLLTALVVRYTRSAKLDKVNKKVKEKIYWSLALRFVFESYLEFLICVTIGVMNLQWSSTNPAVSYNSIFTLTFGVVLVIILLTTIFYFFKIN